MRKVGFICRNTNSFTKVDSLLTLYNSLVLPIFTYGAIIWSPHFNVDIYKLDKVSST